MTRCDKCKNIVATIYPKLTKQKGKIIKREHLCEKCTDYLK